VIRFQGSPSGTAKASNAHHLIVHQYALPGPARDRAAPSPPSAWAVATRDPQPASARWTLPCEPSSTMRGTRKPSHGLSELLGQGNKALAAMNHLHITPTRIGAYLIVAAQPSRSTSRRPASQQRCRYSQLRPLWIQNYRNPPNQHVAIQKRIVLQYSMPGEVKTCERCLLRWFREASITAQRLVHQPDQAPPPQCCH
jgi:hypothetical protein